MSCLVLGASLPRFHDPGPPARDLGIGYATIDEVAEEARARGLLTRSLELGVVPGRAGRVAVPGERGARAKN